MSGCVNHYKVALVEGAIKTVKNKYSLLSVSGTGLIIIDLKLHLYHIMPAWNIKKWHIIMPTKQKREKNMNSRSHQY